MLYMYVFTCKNIQYVLPKSRILSSAPRSLEIPVAFPVVRHSLVKSSKWSRTDLWKLLGQTMYTVFKFFQTAFSKQVYLCA